ncbi:MAG: sigma-54-dependent Fis family transcriptional regulator [Calditrichaeota bacterium]|nr:MAG: sigma-54-dependent Fis family transcriptional regulator [Calditrichota bacterium]
MREPAALLNRVMDIALETIGARRGFILLKSPRQAEGFEVVCSRNIHRKAIADLREFSGSVVERVLNEQQPVLTVDASHDERFAGAESVQLHHIRSVICVPLICRKETVGAIYLDGDQTTRFEEGDLRFVEAFGRQISIALENAHLLHELRVENSRLKRQLSLSQMFPEIIGQSQAIRKILEVVRSVADSDATVLIEGESGTGKELIARALHRHSSRRDQPFIPVFCGTLAETLLESELFGHRRGAFTGATEDKLGLLEVADGGTVFLDEISEISPSVQARLLRILQEGEIKRVGESTIRRVNLRLIAATNRNLYQQVQAGCFREDLYYRLNVIHIQVPPLRERREDIPVLAEHFLKKANRKNNKSVRGFTPSALEAMMAYEWPGNIRELENAVERAVILARGPQITPAQLSLTRSRPDSLIGKPLKDVEKYVIQQTLKLTGYNRTRAAEMLNVSRRWLQYRLKEWGLTESR